MCFELYYGSWMINHFEICSVVRSKEAEVIAKDISVILKRRLCQDFAQWVKYVKIPQAMD